MSHPRRIIIPIQVHSPGDSAPGAGPAASAAQKRAAEASVPTPDPEPTPAKNGEAAARSGAATGDASARPVDPGRGEGSVVAGDVPLSEATKRGFSDGAPDGPSGTSPDATEAALETVEHDLDELTKVTTQRDQYLALAQRTQADFENFRKRKARDAELAEARGVTRVVKELLPALDNLQRAIDAADQADPLLEGVRLVHVDLVSALARLGVESFSPQGEPFDPSEHEAVAQVPTEGAEPGTVVEVYQAGYRASGNVLRPARVVVAA